jgi:rhodanese-related sulfurtransferase
LWADDIERLDLTYAPPYSSARDPVNMAGMIASDIIRGEVKALTPQELEQFLRESGAVLIDVRTAVEREGGAIEGAAHIPLEILRADPEALDRAKTYVLYCAVGYRGYIACRLLSQRGYDVYNLTGGYSAYTMDE